VTGGNGMTRRWFGLPVPLEGSWRVGGNAWAVHLPGLEYMADRPLYPRMSFVVVYEDGMPLPGPHALHAEIRELGDGLFVHWGEYLVYSASDNSDPSRNGRRYTYSRAWWLYRRHYGRWPVTDAQRGLKLEPVNFRVLDSRDEAITRDVDYTLQVIDASLAMLPVDVGTLRGAAVLEIGPGQNLGTALCLASLGARVTVVDLYPPAWDELYHPRLYTALQERLCSERPGWDPEPIRMVVENASHEPVLRCVATGAEAMPTVSDASMDLTLSNAVLEHCADLQAAVVELARVTRPGGLGVHEVDHRDHRHRDRPLEYLLMSDDRFESLFEALHGECGNRFRRFEVERLFNESGLVVERVDVAETAERHYAEQVISQLNRAEGSKYRGIDRIRLEELVCRYVVRRLAESTKSDL
jgi:SAM-dependent methyltransferase